MSMINKCPCGSGHLYEMCCEPYHTEKRNPIDALLLTRSRYAGFVLGLTDYIIDTTHFSSPQYNENRFFWKKKLNQFIAGTEFKSLEILDFKEFGSVALVTFVVHAIKSGKDFTYTEKSYFIKSDKGWLYRSGCYEPGHAPQLVTKSETKALPLAYYGNPILRKKAEPVAKINEEIRQLARNMIETMYVCNGYGIAAPQVHHSLRMFIVLLPSETETDTPLVVINPKISDPSEKSEKKSEGCLSIPFIHEEVERPEAITVEYTDIEGKQQVKTCSGLEARIFMHENDHINGVLFIDRLSKTHRSKLKDVLKKIENLC